MFATNYQMGDLVYSSVALYNDGDIPDIAADALLAEPGARGVIVQTGYLESNPDVRVFLVRFEQGVDRTLGPPVGCFAEELTQDLSREPEQPAAGI